VTIAARPATDPRVTDPDICLLTGMLRLRRFEEKAGMLYALGSVTVPCPLGIGQEGAIAGLFASLDAGDALLALQARPTIELAFGASPAAAFQRLLDISSSALASSALVRLPGEDMRRLPRQDAITTAAGRCADVVVLSDDPGELAQALPVMKARVLPVLMIPADRRPADYGLPAQWTVRECDGSRANGVKEALMSARKESFIAVALLTPPYAGHSRDGSRRPQERRQTDDPIAVLRRLLIEDGRLREVDAVELEAAVRDEIAAAARAVSVACAP
jgi:pyruvate dehydrogenase E1 component alpha subunit